MPITTMMIARATDKDMEAASRLVSILDHLSRGYYLPPTPEMTEQEVDALPTFFDEDDTDHLKAFYEGMKECLNQAPGGLFRIVFGFNTLANPRNSVIDLDSSHLKLHPFMEDALAAYQAEQDAQGFYKPTDALPLPNARVEVMRDYGVRVNNPLHPAHGCRFGIEATQFNPRHGFACDLISTGVTVKWRPAEPAQNNQGGQQ